MSNIFNSVHSKRPPRNNFNLTHEILTSGRIGNLIPIQCDLAVPGQFLHQSADFLMRFAPLAGPAMVRMNVHFHTFFVPLRLCTPRDSENSTFQEFMLKFKDGKENLPKLPTLVCVGDDGAPIHYNLPSIRDVSIEGEFYNNGLFKEEFQIGSLWDYMKLPVYTNASSEIANGYAWPKDGISLMPFIAYQKIYDDWYRRDQIEKRVLLPRNLGEVAVGDFEIAFMDNDIVPDDWNEGVYEGVTGQTSYQEAINLCIHNLFKLRQRNYERDYFTSALPEPQFGDEVFLSDGELTIAESFGGTSNMRMEFSDLVFGGFKFGIDSLTSARRDLYIPSNSPYVGYDNNEGTTSHVFALDGVNRATVLSGTLEKFKGLQAPAITINQLRVGMQMQGFLEKLNRGGTRFKEFSNIIYHVDVPDARLQRVEYVGGFKNPVTIGTVVQTSQTTEESALGTLAGRGTALGGNMLSKGKKLVWEHGYYITLMSVTPRTSYYGGIPRLFSLADPIDYYIPDFDRLGEDAVYNRELFADLFDTYGEQGMQDEIFGYLPMYSYLKSSTSTVTGEFRTTLNYLHVSRAFDGTPSLSPEFIKCMPEDFDRLFAFENVENTSNEHFYAQVLLNQVAKKPMSKYSTPLTLM